MHLVQWEVPKYIKFKKNAAPQEYTVLLVLKQGKAVKMPWVLKTELGLYVSSQSCFHGTLATC